MLTCPDFHVHTSFSTDSTEEMERAVQRAIALGMPLLCFTDHQDLDCPIAGYQLDVPAYYQEVQRLRAQYGDQLDILFGVEMGIQPHLGGTGRVERFLDAYPFDYVIGSVHMVDREDPYFRDQFALSDAELYRRYFTQMLESLQTIEGYQSLGHLNYIIRYGYDHGVSYTYEAYQDVLDAILQVLIDKDLALEINTAGYRKGCNAPNPDLSIVKRYHALGGERVILGSDAHRAADIAADFDRGMALLQEAGFSHLTLFRNKEPFSFPVS